MQILCHGLKEEDFTVDFVDHEISLGCEDSNDIVVASAGVSDRHAVLTENAGELFIKDSGSLNGTCLNRQLVRDAQKLSSGDVIQIGTQQIEVVFSSDGAEATLNFLPNMLDEDNSEGATAMTVLADANMLKELDSADPEETSKTVNTKEIVVTSTKDFFVEGRELGKYVIISRIGKGGMGEIYLAKHKTLGTYRALKVLPKEFQEDNAKFFERFIREAKLASEIRHPNVVAVMDIETDSSSGFSYIVMEYIDGGSLRRILKSNRNLPEEQAVIIVEAIASALRTAEEHGIVHRDIKPDNIMFTKQGETKLADLGIAKNDEEDSELTKSNVMIGTPAYLPPEQVEDAKNVDMRADIYSLGATFYEMLTGQHPYPGRSTYEILHKLFTDPVPDPRKINPGVSAATAAIVMKMLAKDAKDRFQSAGELLETMDRTFPPHTANESADLIKKLIAGNCENNTTFHSGISSVPFMKRKLFRKILKWVGLSLLFCGCCLGVFYYLLHKSGILRRPEDQTQVSSRRTSRQNQYVLEIKTTPDSEIRFLFPDGLSSVYYSDQDGLLKIPGLQAGNYQVSISRKNYRSLTRNISLQGSMTLDMPMTPDLKELIVQALPGTMVKVSGAENRERSIVVPATGIAVFPGLKEETLSIQTELQGWEAYNRTILLDKDQKIRIVQKRRQVTLTVRTAPFAEILLKQDGKKTHSGKANSLGVAVIDEIPTGRYTVFVSGKGCHDREIVCSLERNDNVDIELKKITYSLKINAAPDTQIMLFLDHRLLGTYLVPETGWLHLTDMAPGNYAIAAEKKGMLGKRLIVSLDQDRSVDCRLTKTLPGAAAGTSRQVSPGRDSKGTALFPSGTPSPAVVQTGTIKVYFLASAELMNIVAKDGVEITVGDQTWSNIRKFPWSQQITAGKYRIRAKAAGIRELSIPQFVVRADRENECLLEPVVLPSVVRFVSNRKETNIAFGELSCSPEEEKPCETFREYTVTAVYRGEKITKKFRSMIPGGKVQLEFFFADRKHPGQKQYEEGMKLFSDRKYEEALKKFVPVAEAGHAGAARKVAEIYERGLGMWFSSSSEAMKWYWKAAEAGDQEAALKVARAIDQGDCKGTASQMLHFYLTAAALKHPDVFYRISTIYRNGDREVPQDDGKALHYLRLAAEGEHPDAMFDLGIRYESGHGVTFNIQTALKWINKAADAGCEKAIRYRSNLNP